VGTRHVRNALKTIPVKTARKDARGIRVADAQVQQPPCPDLTY
jgi:hypothetical protein